MSSAKFSIYLGRMARYLRPVLEFRHPRGSGAAAAILIVLGAAGYGVVRGGLLQDVIEQVTDARDAIANAAGFRIASVAIGGENEVSRDDILSLAGVGPRSSLLFLDADAARARLKSNPWIAEATILKLYPDRLHVNIAERHAFALWQKDGQLSVIAADGTVVQPSVDMRFALLPLVVGRGAAGKASEFLTLLDRYPVIRDQVRASILVAERRWNLKLKNGLDIRLPEFGVERALETLVSLDQDKKLLTRDILAVDLRLADRVTVRLSDSAAQAREDAFKDKVTMKRKGNDA